MLGCVLKNSGNCNKMGTRICKIVEEMAEIIEPKVGNPKNSVSRNWAILSYPWNLIFLRMRFSNFFLDYMVWKYQNEIAPILYNGISTKTDEKDIKIPDCPLTEKVLTECPCIILLHAASNSDSWLSKYKYENLSQYTNIEIKSEFPGTAIYICCRAGDQRRTARTAVTSVPPHTAHPHLAVLLTEVRAALGILGCKLRHFIIYSLGSPKTLKN